MERVCAHTFDWGDYIPKVWEDWLADEQDLVIVGEVGQQMVALSRITFQASGQVWLSGMRVEPEHRRLGIGEQFLKYSLDYAREHGARVVRLGTSRNNTAVHHMVAHAAMERVGSYVWWRADPLDEGPEPPLVKPEHDAEIRAFLDQSPALAHTQGLYGLDWVWQELVPEQVAHFLTSGVVLAERTSADRGPLKIAALIMACHEPCDNVIWIGFADGQFPAVTRLASAVRVQASRSGAQGVQVMLPDLDGLRDAFGAAGYTFGDWEGELWIFECRFPQRGAGHDG
jgi:GNAT superfamily N-acetyltransferase